MSGEWTAGEIGAYDQYLADADAEVGRLVETLQGCMANRGEHQGMADVTALLSRRSAAEITGLLAAALKRLAAGNVAPL